MQTLTNISHIYSVLQVHCHLPWWTLRRFRDLFRNQLRAPPTFLSPCLLIEDIVLLVRLSGKHESELFGSEFLSAWVLNLSLSRRSLVVRIFELLYDRLGLEKSNLTRWAYFEAAYYQVQGPIINLSLNHTSFNYLRGLKVIQASGQIKAQNSLHSFLVARPNKVWASNKVKA